MNLNLTKRQKIIISSILLTLGLFSTQLVDFDLRFRFIAGLALSAYFLSLWALWEGLSPIKAVVLLILPTLYALAVASFYFLLPVRWLTRLPVGLFFGLTFYLLLLSQNVFNVASLRTIPLYRAASTANFLFTLITAFFIINVLAAFNLPFWANGGFVFVISFPLIMQFIWAQEMEDSMGTAILGQTFILSLVLGELALAFSFWPIKAPMFSLAVSSSMYVLLGLLTGWLKNRLNRRVIWEYLIIGMAVFMVAFLTTSWIG